MMEKAFEKLPRKRIYEITGIQFMQLNTLYQLLSMQLQGSPALEIADRLLMVPDLINYWLTGRAVAEFSEVTTTQMYDAQLSDWSPEIIAAMGFPKRIFPEIVPPGTRLGRLRPSLLKELGCDFEVVTSVSHDTGSAVAAVPAEKDDFIWISSGTWSIIGMNTQAPVINELSYEHNLANEGGRAGTNRFEKNVMGLWLVQQCRCEWRDQGKNYSYTELTDMARRAPHMKTIVDPDYNAFFQMGGMLEKIQKYCQITGQPVPETEGETIRAILQGLALRYRNAIELLEAISGKKTTDIHIVGGGTKNELLSQFTADALGRKVVTGPIEATAIGNIIIQAQSMGGVANYQEGLAVIRNSFDIKTFLPGDRSSWNQAFALLKENEKKIKLAF
jgi:sugar (pentulose or hexulose) kinase